MPQIHVIAVAFERLGELKVFVQSWLNQTHEDWFLTVLHDGPNQDFDQIMAGYSAISGGRIEFGSSPSRFNDYGHSLREIGLKNIKGKYVLLTNADNYFIPKAAAFLIDAIEQSHADVVIFDMIHSHQNPGGRPQLAYSLFVTEYRRYSIDMSAAIVRAELAAKAGFRDKTHDGDATYFEDVVAANAPAPVTLVKIPRVLFVHN